MGTDNQKENFETRLQNVKRSERRISEMECRVQCLRENINRLEKMLPKNDFIEPSKNDEFLDTATNHTKSTRDKSVSTDVCTADAMVKREKFLQKQIYDMECTEKAYMYQIANLKESQTSENDKRIQNMNSIIMQKNHETIAKKRLSPLESCGQKSSSNLQNLEKSHVDLTKEAKNLSQVLNTMQREHLERKNDSRNSSSCSKEEALKSVKCSCQVLPKCDSCITCSCDEWECDLPSDNEDIKQEKCFIEKNVRPVPKKCSCDEISSSSEDLDLCECSHIRQNQLHNSKCGNLDLESVFSNFLNDEKTFYSEKSKRTCFCSKNQSHDDLSSESDSDVTNMCKQRDKAFSKNNSIERCRGGFDTVDLKPIDLNKHLNQTQQSDLSPLLRLTGDHLKLLKVEELREGLERLKIRNRNLKDFLHTFENPLTLVPTSSDATTMCTEVSSCYTFDLARKTRSGLMTVVKVLEGKCRNKNDIIVALADELKTDGKKKFRIKDKESKIQSIKSWKNLLEEKKIGKKFTKKDSAIGCLIFLMILISHIRKPEIISYLVTVKDISIDWPIKLILFVNKSEIFSFDFLSIIYKKSQYAAEGSIKYIIYRWEEINLWLNKIFYWFCKELPTHINYVIDFLAKNQIYVISILSLVTFLILMAKFIKNKIEIISFSDVIKQEKLLNVHESARGTIVVFIKILNEQVLSSRIFWYIIGFSSHILWNFLEEDFFKLIHFLGYYNNDNIKKAAQENFQSHDLEEEKFFNIFNYLNYCSVISIFSANIRNLIELSYCVLKNLIV